MSEVKCCGNCKHFKKENVLGFGYCSFHESERQVPYVCANYEYVPHSFNGWTEITPDNEHEITDEIYDRVIIGTIDCRGKMHIAPLANYFMGIGTMAKVGGCYYFVLPELKKEESKWNQ